MSDEMLAWLWTGFAFLSMGVWVPLLELVRRLYLRRAAAQSNGFSASVELHVSTTSAAGGLQLGGHRSRLPPRAE